MIYKSILYTLGIALIIIIYGCKEPVVRIDPKMIEIDGNMYRSVSIGKQIWSTGNLNVSHYRNGDIIPEVKNKDEWYLLKTGAWCYYDNDSMNAFYGKLYNWYAVNDSRGLAPEGWHIPSDSEWLSLKDFLDDDSEDGGKLKDTILWGSPNINATNETGFSSLPSGYRTGSGYFYDFGKYACYWSSTIKFYNYIWSVYLFYEDSYLSRDDFEMNQGMSVRCIKD